MPYILMPYIKSAQNLSLRDREKKGVRADGVTVWMAEEASSLLVTLAGEHAQGRPQSSTFY